MKILATYLPNALLAKCKQTLFQCQSFTFRGRRGIIFEALAGILVSFGRPWVLLWASWELFGDRVEFDIFLA
jgi:hypothetical protein